MATLDELREARERIDKWWKAAGDYFPDPEDPDKRFSWRIKAKYYAGALDAYSDYVKLLEADRAAQQQRIGALEAALEPFALMGEIFVNSATIHPSYAGRDREIYSLNDVVLTRGNFEDAYHLLHADACDKGA